MTTIQVCRTCLAHDTRMYTIVNSPLLMLYERITNSTCNMEDEKPLAVCYICYHLLQKYYRFTESALKADEVLQQICNSKIQITEKYMARIDKTILFTFQMSPVSTVDINPDNVEMKREEIKIEFESDQGETALDASEDTNQENTMDFTIKTETVLENSEGEDEVESCREDPLHSTLELDDDEPLSSVSVKKEDEVVEMKSVPKVTKGVRGPQKRKLEVTSKEDVAAGNSAKNLSKTKAGTKKRKVGQCTISPDKLEVSSQEDTENSTSVTKMKDLATVEHCGTKKFGQKKHLTAQDSIDGGDKLYACTFNLCEKKFKHKIGLKSHLRIHTGEKPFKCDYCEEQFTQKRTLTSHLRIHTGEKPVICDYCGKKFTHTHHLTCHLRIHTGEKPYTCNYCEKKFTHKTTFTVHVRTHTGEKPFKCSYCEKSFSRKYQKRDHERIHTGEKPFLCNLCGKKFTKRNQLFAHNRSHTGEKPFSCNYCERKFTRKEYLRDHEKIHTGEKLETKLKKSKVK